MSSYREAHRVGKRRQAVHVRRSRPNRRSVHLERHSPTRKTSPVRRALQVGG